MQKTYSKVPSRLNESLDLTGSTRTRSIIHRPHIPKLRSGSNPTLNTSTASNTTENSFIKYQDSFSISGKPPRVPILKTSQMRQKEKSEAFSEVDDKYYYSEYKKHEIIKSRHISSASNPFWFLDSLALDDFWTRKVKDSNRTSNFSMQELNSNLPDRTEFSNWMCYMVEKEY